MCLIIPLKNRQIEYLYVLLGIHFDRRVKEVQEKKKKKNREKGEGSNKT